MSADLFVSFRWESGEMQRDIIQIMTLFLLQYKNLQCVGGKAGRKKTNKN